MCDKSWLPSLSQSFYQIGYVVNGLLLGYLSDRFGRRPVLWLALVIEICGGLSMIFSYSMVQYIISRFFLGLGDSGRGVCLYLLIIETVSLTIQYFETFNPSNERSVQNIGLISQYL